MILFADFDGVLHPDPPGRKTNEQLFCRLPLLEAWLRGRPSVDVVISSNWRETCTLENLVSYFTEDLRDRILGCTPVLKRESWPQFDGELPPVRFPREAEVLGWLTKSAEPWRPWAALDDQPHLFKPFNAHLVVCDRAIGLTAGELVKVDAVLGIAR